MTIIDNVVSRLERKVFTGLEPNLSTMLALSVSTTLETKELRWPE